MPVYVRKNLLSITPESLGNRSSDEEDYIRDPEQMYDVLPQPFRLVNKIVNMIFDLSWEIISEREAARIEERSRVKPPQYDYAIPLPTLRNQEVHQNCSMLPQPFRLVNKIVNMIFDLSWEIISEREAARIAERSRVKPPQYDYAIPLPEYGQALCISDSPDGRYVFFGMPHGIVMIDAMTQAPIALWEDGAEDANICTLTVCLIGVQTYLITAIDTAGTGRLLCCAFDAIHLIKTFNEDITGLLVTNTVISGDGDYVCVALQHGVEVWLDVWHLPRDNWLRELETAHSSAVKQQQQQTKPAEPEKLESCIEMATSIEGIITDNTIKSTSSGSPRGSPTPHPGGASSTSALSLNMSQISKPTTVLRVRPPATTLTGVSCSVSSAFRAIDEGHVVGLGTKQHLITDQHLDKRRQVFRQQHEDQLRFMTEDNNAPRPQPLCTFLNPSFMLVTSMESSNDRPSSVAVAWTGSTNVCHYNLLKHSKDLEHKPDIVWPYGSVITCIAASPCTSLLAVGHCDGALTIYDHHMGLTQAVHKLSSMGEVSQVDFLNPSILPPAQSPSNHSATPDAYLIAYCTDGSVSVIRCGYEEPVTVRVVEPPSSDHMEKVVYVQLLTGIPQVIVVVRGGGEVSLVDVRRGHALCIVALRAADCKLMAVVPPILTPAANAHMFYVKGTKEASEGSEVTPGDGSMFVFPLRSFPALDPFMKNPTDNQPYSVHVTVQNRFDSLLSKRLIYQNDRQQRMQRRWHHLNPQVISCK